ncbi:MAG: CotH kinase family protein [Limisphaerales bacterium]
MKSRDGRSGRLSVMARGFVPARSGLFPLWASLAVALTACSPPASNGLPDAIRSSAHEPVAPRGGEAVSIVAKADSKVSQLTLETQVVEPGRYIAQSSRSFRTQWRTHAMVKEAGAGNGAGEVEFRAELPGTFQKHRHLVRYRFRGETADGTKFVHPDPEGTHPNLAYFVYDGIPSWRGAIEPGGREPARRDPVVFDSEALSRVQSYHLIAERRTIDKISGEERDHSREYRYTATLVVDGVAYDHIKLRARGGVWRFAVGKNMLKFNLLKGQRLKARDDYGRTYPVSWDKVNLRSCIQQGDYGYRGEQGMFEAVGFRLFQLAGVPAPNTHWIQLRVVTDAEESPADQYEGDYWGLYLAIEEVDGRFLKARDLPDGNVYKMEMGGGTISHQAEKGVSNGSDLAAFVRGYARGRPSEAWWRGNLDLQNYYSYRAICECIHHYDIGDGKNYFYYRNPKTERWRVIPWDIDLTWADTMYGTGEEPFHRRALGNPALGREYLNRLRELRDLLYNPEETGRLIDECAAIVADPGGRPSPVGADRAKWDYHPRMLHGEKAGHGLFYQRAPGKDFAGMTQLMKDYVRWRGDWIDKRLLAGEAVPATPQISYIGPEGFPSDSDGLTFRASGFRGVNGFSAIQWRLAEIAPPTLDKGRPVAPGRYEITPTWESEVMERFAPEVVVPGSAILAGRKYRARVRMRDTEGSWSHWSAPVEFVAGSAKVPR